MVGAPADGGILHERAHGIAHHQGGSAEAHHQRTGAGALFVGEPGVDGGDNHIISDADAQPRQHAIADVQHGHARAVQPGGEKKAQAGQHARQDQGGPGADPLGQQAPHHAAQAEEAHRQGEIQGQLVGGPAEVRRQGGLQNGPAVDDAREQQGKDARRQVQPADVQVFFAHMLPRLSYKMDGGRAPSNLAIYILLNLSLVVYP